MVIVDTAAPEPLDVPALVVHQWLDDWDRIDWDPRQRRREPERHFYLFTLPASTLKRLSGIQRREAQTGLPRAEDLGIQRFHDEGRSQEIKEFIQYGHPLVDVAASRRNEPEFASLRKPGWLPTAIVLNIVRTDDERLGLRIAPEDAVTVTTGEGGTATIHLPAGCHRSDWSPAVRPIEVIDGQHRLWAFGDDMELPEFQLPVVAFYGLDISWQAYLFWTINIKPKRLNQSLAFDLYPLLRTEDWLDRFSGHRVYREARAQELTEALWSHPESPWYRRISMLGETIQQRGSPSRAVSQAAWVRALVATFLRYWEAPAEGQQASASTERLGGLFGAPVGRHELVLPWSGAEQAAFLIAAWLAVQRAVQATDAPWAQALRESQESPEIEGRTYDAAFAGAGSLLATDQGLRGVLAVTNDLCYVRAQEMDLDQWRGGKGNRATDIEAVSAALESLKKHPVSEYLHSVAAGLARADWRTPGAPSLQGEDERRQSAFRGSGGYRALREYLLLHLDDEEDKVGPAAADVLRRS